MGGVLPAPPAVLLQLQTVRIVLLVLDRRVVPPFALRALEGDDRFHRSISLAGEGKEGLVALGAINGTRCSGLFHRRPNIGRRDVARRAPWRPDRRGAPPARA